MEMRLSFQRHLIEMVVLQILKIQPAIFRVIGKYLIISRLEVSGSIWKVYLSFLYTQSKSANDYDSCIVKYRLIKTKTYKGVVKIAVETANRRKICPSIEATSIVLSRLCISKESRCFPLAFECVEHKSSGSVSAVV